MNAQFQKKEYNGFTLADTLASKLNFSGIIRLHEKEMRIIPESPSRPEMVYWVLKDEFGARFSCFNKELVERLEFFTPYEVKGEIKIGKGGSYFNLKSANVFLGSEFQTKGEKNNEIIGEEGSGGGSPIAMPTSEF